MLIVLEGDHRSPNSLDVLQQESCSICTVHTYVFESSNLCYICKQVMTATLPFCESLDDCSHDLIMSCYILFAYVSGSTQLPKMWP